MSEATHKVKIVLELDVWQCDEQSAANTEALDSIQSLIEERSTSASGGNYRLYELYENQPVITVTKVSVVEPEMPKAEEVDWELKNLRRWVLINERRRNVIGDNERLELIELNHEIRRHYISLFPKDWALQENAFADLNKRTRARFPDECRKYGIS